MEVYTPLDLGRLALVGLRLESRALPPAGPGAGDVYLDTTTGYPMVYTGTAWVRMAAAAITDADVAAGAGIALSKLATDPLARANHTGTQLAATISDLTTRIRSNRLDQFAVPTAAVSLNSQQINNLADPTSPTDAANRAFVLTQLATALLRSNHTGTQLAATISDFDSAVRLNRLDQLAAPTGPVSLAAQLLTNLADPVSAQDAATRAFVLAQAATAYSRANHTGTQLAATISDFDTAVRLNRLDQLAAPTASVNLNSQKITNLATPTVGTDAATAAYAIARANHTGTQTAATISNFTTTVNGIVAATSITALYKAMANLNLDGFRIINLGTPTLGNDAATADFASARANHTGTQLASTISDFDSAVRLNRMEQLAAPLASVALNSQRITGLADPTAAQDAATRSYVQAGDWKATVRLRVGTQSNLASVFSVLDGVAAIPGWRVLLTGQTASAENGIYVVNALNMLVRATDADSATTLSGGATVYVEAGTSSGSVWTLTTTTDPLVVGTTALTWQQLTAVASKKLYNVDLGALVADVPYAVTHGMGTADLVVSVRNASSGQVHMFDTVITSTQVIITPGAAFAAGLRLTAISGV